MADWTGGYFETNWSVNPTWTAHYKHLPQHEVTRGVKPFTTHDEWYYHMRFLGGTNDVTPILTDLPPASTLSRSDGTHSGNKYVRQAVANGQPQTMAWARQRRTAAAASASRGPTTIGTGATTTSASWC